MSGAQVKVLEEAMAGNRLPIGRATSLPADFYLDSDLYALETRAVFRDTWLPVCRIDEVPARPGYRPVSVGGSDLLLVRDESGAIRLLANACSHRGMLLAESASDDCRIECPYHRWTYDLNGELRSAPLAAPALDRVSLKVPEVRHEIWLGWVFANLSGDAEPLVPQLTGLTEVVTGWGIENMVTAASRTYESGWNWKVMWENFNEYYHHIGTHRYTLEPLLPARTSRSVDNDGQPWSCTSMPCDPDYLAMQAFVTSTGSPTDDMHLFSVFPLLCAGVQPGSAFWMQILPGTVDKHQVVWHLLLPPGAREEAGYQERLDATMEGLEQIHLEDMDTCRLVDRGLRSSVRHPTVLTDWERPVWQLHRWLLKRIAAIVSVAPAK